MEMKDRQFATVAVAEPAEAMTAESNEKMADITPKDIASPVYNDIWFA